MSELPDDLQRRTAVLLRTALSRAEHLGEEALRPLALTGREYGVLSLLAHGTGGPNQRHLGAQLGLDRTTTMKLMAALEARGLVRRETDSLDRRSYRLDVTARGKELAARADRVLAACDDALTEGRLDDSEVALLRDMLRRLT